MNTKTKAEQDAAEDVSALSAEIGKVREEFTSLVESVGRVGKERAQALRDGPIADGIAAGGAAIDDVSAELRELERRITESTRARPLRALGVAAAIGFLLGFLTRR